MSEEQNFRELLRRVRSGDEGAAAELVRRYEPTIRRIARVRLADSRLQRVFDSMDICQSVLGSFFVRVALGQYDLETPEQLLKLLVSMTRKKVIDHVRSARAERRDYRREREESPAGQKALARDPTPSQQIATKELLTEFRRRMSEDERQLADLRATGRAWEEIAVERGQSAEALRKQLSRAVDRISRELDLETNP
jgi:RNA polymerase sigma-70 factor (ECF subfamily)